jgi:hypothetical protein
MQFASKSLFPMAVLALALSASGFASTLKTDSFTQYRPSGKGWGVIDEEATVAAMKQGGLEQAMAKAARTKAITYHGGPVMTAATTNLYYIWYGNWSNYSTAKTVLAAFGSSLGGTPAYNVNTSYYNGSSVKVKNSVTLVSQVSDSYSQGTTLSDAGVLAVVTKAISSGALPKDANALYFVLTSPDVQESSGFGSQYCGWHDHATVSGTDIKYSFVGNPLTIAPSGCGVNNPSPNGDGGADAMTSVIYHELSETVSDPDINAWYDSTGAENGDKCAWNFGTTFTTSNGAKANQTFGSRNWLLQQMWLNVGSGSCVQKY